MRKRKFSPKVKKVVSSIMAAVMVIGAIPVSTFLNGAIDASAKKADNWYQPKVIGAGVLCADLLTAGKSDEEKTKIWNSLVRRNSYMEDTANGSIYNNIGLMGYKYSASRSGTGIAYSIKMDDYPVLKTLAENGQIKQNLMAMLTNDKHKNFWNHPGGSKTQYCKIILGYPTDDKFNMFWVSQEYTSEEKQADGTMEVGNRTSIKKNDIDIDSWETLKPTNGYENNLSVYMTTKKGCESCGSAKIEKVSVAFKDEKEPTISSILITNSADSDQAVSYFKAGNEMYIKVKFSEYVRLADADENSTQSKNIKLGLKLGKKNTEEVENVYAELYSLKEDTAIFYYEVPAKVGDEDTDFFINSLSDITKQESLIVKKDSKGNKKFNRNFLDYSGKVMDYKSGTIKNLKEALYGKGQSNETYDNAIRKTTSAITDLAGNPLSLNSFPAAGGKKGVSIATTILDAVKPVITSVNLNRKDQVTKANAGNFLKDGSELEISIEINEELQSVSTDDLSKIKAVLNLEDGSSNAVKVTAESVVFDSKTGKTTIKFQNLKITKSMNFSQEWRTKYNDPSDYRITIVDLEYSTYLKDSSSNELAEVGDQRANTSNVYYLDWTPPMIQIDSADVSSAKKYEMARVLIPNVKEEVYRIVVKISDFNPWDSKTTSNNATLPFFSGVIGGKATLKIALNGVSSSDYPIMTYSSLSSVSEKELKEKLNGTNEFKVTGPQDIIEYNLLKQESDLYLYVKFDQGLDYSAVKNGLNLEITAQDLNGNQSSATATYEYDPLDKISPRISYQTRDKELKQEDGSIYNEVKVSIFDAGGIDIDNIKYVWVEKSKTQEEVSVPDLSQFQTADRNTEVKTKNGEEIGSDVKSLTECTLVLQTKKVAPDEHYDAVLYVWAQDVSEKKNETMSNRLHEVSLDMTLPEMNISVPDASDNKKSSLVVSGPYTTSTQEVAMFAAVQDPMTEDCYFVRTISGTANKIQVNGEEFLNASELPFYYVYQDQTLKQWSYAKLTKTGDTYQMTTICEDLTSSEEGVRRGRFLAITGDRYYGEVSVIAGTGFKDNEGAFTFENEKEKASFTFDAQKGKFFQKTFTMIPYSYAFSDCLDVEADNFLSYLTEINKADITPQGNYGQQRKREDYQNYNPETNQPEYLSSLAGASFAIKFSTERTNDFVMKDVDYNSEDTYIKLFHIDGSTKTEVYEFPLIAGQPNQTITIPENLILKNGKYRVEVSLSSIKGEGEVQAHIDKYSYDDIYLYNYDNDVRQAFGIRKVTTNIVYQLRDLYGYGEKPYYGYESVGDYEFEKTLVDNYVSDFTSNSQSAYAADVLYLGSCTTTRLEKSEKDFADVFYGRSIQFSVNGMTKSDAHNYWIKIWTGDNKEKAKWFKLTDFDEETQTLNLDVKPIDGKVDYDAENAEEVYNNSDFLAVEECQIPVFEGSNVLSYCLMNQGGVVTPVHETEVFYSTKAPNFQIEVEDGVMIKQSENAYVTQLSSDLVLQDIELYESDFSGNENAVSPITERSFTYTDKGRHFYYVLDGYRNLNYQQFYITNVDNEEPTAEFIDLSPTEKYEWGGISYPMFMINVKDDQDLRGASIQLRFDDGDAFTFPSYDAQIPSYGDTEYGRTYNYDFKDDATQVLETLNATFSRNEDAGYSFWIQAYLKPEVDLTKEHEAKIPHKITLEIVDACGNVMQTLSSEDQAEEFYGINEIPKLLQVESFSEYNQAELIFQAPVQVTKINGVEVPLDLLYMGGFYSDHFTLSTARQMLKEFIHSGSDDGIEYGYEDSAGDSNSDSIEDSAGDSNSDSAGDSQEEAMLARVKDYFGIAKDGTYEIEFRDSYKNIYKDTFTLENFFGDYSANINYSTVEKTNGDVVATIEGVNKDAVISLKYPDKVSDKYEISWNKKKTKATITFHENAAIPFELTIPGAAEQKTVAYNVTVENIDKTAPSDVEVYWYIKETSDIQQGNELDISSLYNQTTNQDIEVWIESPSEELYEMNGKELCHIFHYSENMERSYTFEYSDQCQNVGEPITVTLPEELIMTGEKEAIPEEGVFEEDAEAPQVSAEIYAVYDGMTEYFSSWNPESEDFANIAEQMGYAGGYKISYTLVDESKAKIVLLNGLNADTSNLTFESSSEQIEGASVDEVNQSVLITKQGSYTVAAIDKAGNIAKHSFSITYIDTEAPNVTVQKAGQSFTKMRIKFYLDDNTDANNAKGTIVPVSTGLSQGMDDQGNYYYKDVEYNGVYNVIFKDRSGNRRNVSTNVTEIDRDAPNIQVTSWSPSYVYNGQAYDKQPPTEPINTSVVVSLEFNKTVSELKVFYQQDDNWIEDKNGFSNINVEFGGRKGKVEFFDAVPSIVKIVATAPNGVSNELKDIDLVGIIDKKAPEITMTKKLENNQMHLVFHSDETVVVNGAGLNRQYGKNTDIPLNVKANGTYSLSFSDAAGNITEKEITVDEIDEIAPVVYATGIPETYIKPSECEVKVTMSEAGTLSFRGTDYSVKAPEDKDGDGKFTGDELEWITLPINANGSYQIKAVDAAGLVSYRVLEIDHIDDKAPSVQFNQSIVNIFAGTEEAELKAELLDETTFILWDDYDEDPQIELKKSLSTSDLENQGIHEVVYLLRDHVGNETTVKRYVKVISAANLKITANDQLLLPCDTTILRTNQVDFNLEKSDRKGESYKVYYKKGILKAGDMKKADSVKNGKLRNLESGIYTLYIVTQNKETYLTYLYIDMEE